MKVSVRLHNKETGEIKEQEIFMGDFPDDPLRNLRHQRRRACGGQPDRPLPGIYYGKETDLKTDLPPADVYGYPLSGCLAGV